MAKSTIHPCLLAADDQGQIFDIPELLMLCRKGHEWTLPRPDELIPLPPESELFLLPGRHAAGLDPETGEAVEVEGLAVAAFVAPGYTLGANPVYSTQPDAPVLPLFAYGAVGMVGDKFYVCAKRVDEDPRQIFTGISRKKLERGARNLMERFPHNRLMQHLMGNCVLRYGCPAAKNLSLGRYEAPLPVSRTCNARCFGCISHKDDEAKICTTPQDRLTFTPTAQELVEVMEYHQTNEERPIYSFGQGCEGEPLTEAPLLEEAIRLFRQRGGKGTINLNSNASLPQSIARLADAGLSSLRVSLNSARPEVYERYYRPVGYKREDVLESMRIASGAGVHLALNLLYFPGVTDCEEEIEALGEMITECGVDLIQLRNLNIDPETYMALLEGISFGPSTGLANFRKRLRKVRPNLAFGYFNPYLEEATKE